MGYFNSDDHCIYYCRQESLRRNGVTLRVNKRAWNKELLSNLKNDRMISVRFQGIPFNITVIQIYAPNTNAEEAEVEWFYDDLQDLLVLTPRKDVLFITGEWKAKGGSQEIPVVTGTFSLEVQNEAGHRLRVWPRQCTSHSKHRLPTTQETSLNRDITRWSVPKEIVFFTPESGEDLSVHFSSLTESCMTLCNPMNHSMSGFLVHHQLPEFTQTHVHRVGDAIQSSHPLSSPSPSVSYLSQH